MGILNNAQRSIVIPEPEGLPNSSYCSRDTLAGLPISRVAGVWPDEKVVFILSHQVNAAKISSIYDFKIHDIIFQSITCFMSSIKTKVTFFGYS